MKSVVAAVLFAAFAPAAIAAADVTDITAFTLTWDPAAAASLAAHANAIDALSPQWVLLKNAAGEVDVTIDDATLRILAESIRQPKLLPIVANYTNEIWDGKMVAALLRDTSAREAFVGTLIAQARAHRFAGYVIDLENLDTETVAVMPVFIAAVSQRFRDAGLELWLTVPAGDPWPLPALQQAGAGIVVMAYDQHWETSGPGPIAGTDWFAAALEKRLAGLDKTKVMVGLASYAYDWPPSGRARSMSIAAAKDLAAQKGAALRRDAQSGSTMFSYEAADGVHEVWMNDAASIAAQRAILRTMGIPHIALWRLGTEDEAIWNKKPALR